MADQSKDLEKLLTRGVSEILPSKKDLKKLLKEEKITLYQGFDPSSSDLHIGHLIGIRKLAEFQKLGHKVIFLIGDFTGMIGDPTDKSAVRKRLTKEEVVENAKDYKNQVEKILDFKGENKAEIKYNSEWLSDLTMEEVVELSSNFTVQQLLERDMFRNRLSDNKPIYLHEFLYPLMQGYDSVVMEVDLEIGGNDQLFNMMAGRALLKSLKDKEKYVLTMKLLTSNNKQKMGKTEGNAISLNDKPKDTYGKIMALPDEVLDSAVELLTDLPLNTLDGKGPLRTKKLVAFDVVEQLRGKEDAQKAEEHFEKTFQKGKLPEEPKEIAVKGGKRALYKVLDESGLVKSKSQAKRLLEQGAVEIDGNKVKDQMAETEIDEEGVIVKVGKARFARLKAK